MIIICTYQYNIKIFRNFLHIFYWMKKFCINGRKKINKTNSVTAVGRIVKGGFFCFFFSNFIKKGLVRSKYHLTHYYTVTPKMTLNNETVRRSPRFIGSLVTSQTLFKRCCISLLNNKKKTTYC